MLWYHKAHLFRWMTSDAKNGWWLIKTMNTTKLCDLVGVSLETNIKISRDLSYELAQRDTNIDLGPSSSTTGYLLLKGREKTSKVRKKSVFECLWAKVKRRSSACKCECSKGPGLIASGEGLIASGQSKGQPRWCLLGKVEKSPCLAHVLLK